MMNRQEPSCIQSPSDTSTAPGSVFWRGCNDQKLFYQEGSAGDAIFYPRLTDPQGRVTWRESAGRGFVYAACTQLARDKTATNLSLIELDEGFRMMSSVIGEDDAQVPVGMRVKVEFHPSPIDESQLVPYFVRDPEGNS